MQQYEKALEDFTHVIDTPNVHVSLLLPALRGRVGIYLRLDGDKCFPKDFSRTDRFHTDFDRAEALDPNKPCFCRNESYEVLTNFNIEINNSEFQAEYAKAMVKLNRCQNIEDVKFFANGVVIVKLKEDLPCRCRGECKELIEPKMNACADCLRDVVFGRNNNPTEETDCKYWCDRVSESAKDCVRPFEDFLERVGCEDPIW